MSYQTNATKGGRDPAPKKQVRSIWISDADDAVLLRVGDKNRSVGVRELVRFYLAHYDAQGGER